MWFGFSNEGVIDVLEDGYNFREDSLALRK